MTDDAARLDAIRREIDALDAELLDLLNRRGRMAAEVAAVKDCEVVPRYYRPEREAALLRRLAAANRGPFPDADVMRLFREIVSTCRALEQRLTIGCTTVEEACAATGHFGGAVDVRPLPDAGEALHAVATGRCDLAMLEFSRAGVASPVMADLPGRKALALRRVVRAKRRAIRLGRSRVRAADRKRLELVHPASPRAAGPRVLVPGIEPRNAVDPGLGCSHVFHRRCRGARERAAARAPRRAPWRQGPGRVPRLSWRRSTAVTTAATGRPARAGKR